MEKAYTNEFFLAGVQLADLAAEISKKYFREPLTVETKDHEYPVTVADREIELCLRAWIKETYPDHGVIGEEFAHEDRVCKYTWVIDPIDGTVAFACGKPVFTTLIALLEDGKPVLGIIDQPIVGDRLIGVQGAGAWINGKKLITGTQQNIADARLNATTPYMFKTTVEQTKFARLQKEVKLTSWGGDAYAYGLLADGHIDVIMEADLEYYDVAALRIIIEESGGVITDWTGNPITHNDFSGQCLASANKTLHEKALSIINQ